jgi:AraC-like DNA-binding protein
MVSGDLAAGGGRAEAARYWRHSAVAGVDLLRARYVTHRYGRHAHETYTLGVIESGVEEFEYGGTLRTAGAGAVALLNPEMVHTGQAGAPEGWSYRVFYPAVEVVAGVAAELGWPGTPSFWPVVSYRQDSAALLRAAHQAAERGDRLASSTLLHTALRGLLAAHADHGLAGRRAGPRGGRAPAEVARARDLLGSRLTDPPSLDELAELTGLGPFALLRAFRAQTGLPPHAYLNQLRVREARGLLDAGLAPSDVAASTGFADQAHLTRHFKRVVGVPPGAYQRGRHAGAGRTPHRATCLADPAARGPWRPRRHGGPGRPGCGPGKNVQDRASVRA